MLRFYAEGIFLGLVLGVREGLADEGLALRQNQNRTISRTV